MDLKKSAEESCNDGNEKLQNRKSLEQIWSKVDPKKQVGQEEFTNGFGLGTAAISSNMIKEAEK